MATAAIETFGWLFGWQSEAYTVVYDFFTLFAFAASAGVVWEAWRVSVSSQKASLPRY